MRRSKTRNTYYLMYVVPRRKGATVRVLLVLVSVAAVATGWWLSGPTSRALLLPQPQQTLDFRDFRVNRSLKAYLDNIALLIEPSTERCKGDRLPVVAIVTSTPFHYEQRIAIRSSWGKHIPTFFLMGLMGTSVEDLTVDSYIEAKQYRDIIIYQFQDHYQNLTIKTALLMKWAAASCPRVDFLIKVDDDILVNPWALRKVIHANTDADLIGYRKDNTRFHRDEYNKWYTPRWLCRTDEISQFIAGGAYLVHGRNLQKILSAAYEVPLIHLEDVYFTHLVAKLKLGLELTHDHRLSPYKPWIPATCFYWGLASAHSHTPDEMTNVWHGLERIGEKFESGSEVCGFYEKYFTSELFLY